MNNVDLELKGASLVLKDAIRNLRASICTDCNSAKSGDDDKGVFLAERILDYKDSIDEALDYWERALHNYNSINKHNSKPPKAQEE